MMRIDRRGTVLGAVALLVSLLAACGGGPSVAYKELVDDDPQVRHDAALRLGQGRVTDGVDSLIAIMHDPDEMVRIQVIRSLGEIGDKKATAAIAAMAGDPLSGVRLAVAQALGMMKDPAGVPALSKLLWDEDESVRLASARALGETPGDEALTALLDTALQDEWEWVRQHVVRVIGMRKYRDAVPRLERMLGAESDLVRAHAATVLAEIADPSSVPVLVRALDDPYFKVRSLAAHALGRVAPSDSRVAEALRKRLAVEEIGMTRVDLAWNLVKAGDRSGLEVVRTLLARGDPEDVRAEAARALGEIGDASDVPRLEKALADKKGLVRKEANASLETLKKS